MPGVPLPLQLTDNGATSLGSAFTSLPLAAGSVIKLYWSFSITSRAASSSAWCEGLSFVLHRDSRGAAALGQQRGTAAKDDPTCLGFCGITPAVGARLDCRTGTQELTTLGALRAGASRGAGGEISPASFVAAGGSWWSRVVTVEAVVDTGAGVISLRVMATGTSRTSGVTWHGPYNMSVDVWGALRCDADGEPCPAFVGWTAANSATAASFVRIETVTLPSATAVSSRTSTPTGSSTRSSTATASGTRSATASNTGTASSSRTGTLTLTGSGTHTRTGSGTRTPSHTAPVTGSQTGTGTSAGTHTATVTTTATARRTASSSASPGGTRSPTPRAGHGVTQSAATEGALGAVVDLDRGGERAERVGDAAVGHNVGCNKGACGGS
jgi:hypothetical protein